MTGRIKLKIKRGDRVIVTAGRDKGKRGEVVRVIPEAQRAIVRGVNVVQRHQRQTPQSEGGIISKEASIHISNIALLDPSTNGPTRVGYKKLEDGTKVRFARKSGETFNG